MGIPLPLQDPGAFLARQGLAKSLMPTTVLYHLGGGSGMMINHSRRFGARPAGKGDEAHTAEGGMNWKHAEPLGPTVCVLRTSTDSS